MKLGGRMEHGPREKPSNFGADPTHEADPQIYFNGSKVQ